MKNRTSIKRVAASLVVALLGLLAVGTSAFASLTVTPNGQYGALPFTPSWTPATDSLIGELAPTTATGNFNLEVTGTVNGLTAGGSLTIDSSKANYVACGNGGGAGSNIVYTLPVSPYGYNLTNITVYGGWTDNGRDAQAYTVRYATTANPNTFITLTSVSYDPSPPGGVGSATRVAITDSVGGVIASNVVALQFDFTTPPSLNGYCGYGAITVEGAAASGGASYPVVTADNQYGALPFTPSWTPASDSLIAGLVPSIAAGNFNEEGAGTVDGLTGGGSLTIDSSKANYVACGNGGGAGSNIVYTLPVSTNGYNLTNITVYGGWTDRNRDQQAYTVWYATAANPNTFVALTSVSYNPSSVPVGTPSATRVVITDSAGGVLASNVVALQFDFTTPPSENGYCGYAAITVEGTVASGGHPVATSDNQYGALPFTPSWTPATDSLIAGLVPSIAAGNFNEEGAGTVNGLTAGGSLTIDAHKNNYVVCGNNGIAGSNIVYTLPVSPNGYNLTNITVYGGWTDYGRDQQAYTVWYATAANPNTFVALTSVSYNPSSVPVGTPSATRVVITDSAGGVLASNVVALQFDFTTPPSENGYCGYAAITVEGTVASGIASHPVVAADNQYGALPFTPSWTPATDSLIAGLAPSTAAGNFSLEANRSVGSLTAGGSLTISQNGTTCSTNYVTCGNNGTAGSNIVYTLPVSPNGYNLTNITVYGGWTDYGRDQQAYTVRYATAANPNTFVTLTSVSYNPSSVPVGTPSATRVVITNSAGGVLASNVVALQFDFTTPPSENGYCGYGAITVEGAVANGNASYPVVTADNQYGALPFTPSWTPATDSLIAGLVPSTAAGNFSLEADGRNVNSLTAGGSLTIRQIATTNDGPDGLTCDINYLTCGDGSDLGSSAGSNIVYTLPVSPNGYNLTNITVYGGWTDNGRDAQAYTVRYATVANPGTFVPLTTVSYNPSSVPVGTPSATRVAITSSTGGVLASNVVALEFDFTIPPSENGYCGYAAITVEAANISNVPPVLSGGVWLGSGQFQLTFSGSSGQTYHILSSTNLALPRANWRVLTSGTFGDSPTNYTDTQATNAAGFYQVVSP